MSKIADAQKITRAKITTFTVTYENLSKPCGSWVIDQNNILTVLILNLNLLAY